MKVHLYHVVKGTNSLDLETVLQHLGNESLERRNKQVGTNYIRVEHVQRDGGGWFIDFVKARMEGGPARVGFNTPVAGFELERDEGFGEETGMWYSPVTGYATIQYNHHGVKHGAIGDYLSTFDPNLPGEFQFQIRYDDDLDQRLATKTLFRRLETRIDTRLMNAGDRKAGIGVEQALAFGIQNDADFIEVNISVDRKRDRSLSTNVCDIIQALRGVREGDQSAVSTLKLAAKDDESSVTEILDFISARLEHEYPIQSGPDRRLPRDERMDALRRSHQLWKPTMR
jgi:hypothetical protein